MSSFVRGFGPVLMLLAALLAPVAILATDLHEVLTTEESFVETFGPLAEDREFQGHLVDRTVEEMDLPGLAERATAGLGDFDLEIPSWLADSARTLERWGAPSWITSPLHGSASSATELGAEIVSSGVEAALHSLVQTRAFHTAWQETLRGSHQQVLEQLSAGAPTLILDIAPIVAATKDALIEDGATFARFIPQVSYEVALDVDMPGLSRYATPILDYGNLLIWVPLGLFITGLALTRRRGIWLAVSGAVAAGAALMSRRFLDNPIPTSDPLTESALAALLQVVAPTSGETMLKVAYGAGVLIVIGIAVMLLRLRRR